MNRRVWVAVLAIAVCVTLSGCRGNLPFIEYGSADGAGEIVFKTLGNLGILSALVAGGFVYGLVALLGKCR